MSTTQKWWRVLLADAESTLERVHGRAKTSALLQTLRRSKEDCDAMKGFEPWRFVPENEKLMAHFEGAAELHAEVVRLEREDASGAPSAGHSSASLAKRLVSARTSRIYQL